MPTRCIILAAATLSLAAPLHAQQPATAAQATAPQQVLTTDVRLVFDREVFSYQGSVRRDPFRPLTGSAAGPLFEDLRISVILYSQVPAESVVLINDAGRKQYRLRRGDSVGNATVVDIGPSRVVFSVVDFGIRRQEVLDLKANREGA